MSGTVALVQQRTMARDAWNILTELADLRRMLLKSEYETEADELASHMRSFWFYSLFDSKAILTVAGPQGVGKSTLTNTLLNLSEEEALPVGEGSCEHVPIILVPAAEEEPTGFAITYGFKAAAVGEGYLRETRLSFAEARNRALNPSEDDLVIVWHVKGCKALTRFSPLAVLPGLELHAPWMNGVRFVLDVSDVVIYAVDSARKAQASSAKIEEWMNEVDLAIPPITVVTKADMMTQAQVKSLRSTMGQFDPVMVGQDPSEREAQFTALWGHTMGKLATVHPRARSRRFKRLLRMTKKLARSLREKAIEGQRDAVIDELTVVERVLERLDKRWRSKVKPKVMQALNAELAERREKAVEKGREHRQGITDGFFKKVDLWFCGGPTVDSVNDMENAIRRSYSHGLKDRLAATIQKALPAGISSGSKDGLDSMMAVMILSPSQSLQKDTVALVESMQQAGQIGKAAAEYIGNVAKGVKNAAEQMGELRASVMKDKGEQIALAGTLATAGTATTAMEAAGGGFAGASASVVAAAAGAAVVAVAALGLTSCIVRNSRDVEWQLDNYIKLCAGELEEETEAQFAKHLERSWSEIRYEVREHLSEQLGLNDDDRNAINLLSSLKRVKDCLDEAEASRIS